MTDDDIKLQRDPDWIYIKRYNNSLEELLRRYDGEVVPDRVIAAALNCSEAEVERLYQSCITKLQKHFKINQE